MVDPFTLAWPLFIPFDGLGAFHLSITYFVCLIFAHLFCCTPPISLGRTAFVLERVPSYQTLLASTKLRCLHVYLTLKLEAGVLNWFEGGDDRNGGRRGIVSTALENSKVIYEVRL